MVKKLDTDSEEEDEDTEKPDMFSDFEKPEDTVKKDDSLFFGDEDEFDISFKSDRDFTGNIHHVYDILNNIKTSQDDSDLTNDITPEGEVLSGELHPTILFALKMKWVFDKMEIGMVKTMNSEID